MGNVMPCVSQTPAAKEKDEKHKDSVRSESSVVSSTNSNLSEDSGYDSDKSEEEEENGEGPTYKVLLVGAGESGKSTFFKIVTDRNCQLYEDDAVRLEFKESIHENIIESVKTIVNKCSELQVYYDGDNEYNCCISEDLEDQIELILGIELDEISPSSAEAIISVLHDDGFNTCLTKLRGQFYIPDGAPYFFENIERVVESDYIPNFKDILHCRDRTTGVTHELVPYQYKGKNYNIDMYDVGGQRAERKAWKNIFHDVKIIAYILAISEFDLKCIEDNSTDRLIESLLVLKVLNDSPNFRKTPILLLLTKVDQLESKLKAGKHFTLEPPKDKVLDFKGYHGDNSLESVKDYVLDLCMCQIKGDKKVVHSFKNLVGENVQFTEEFDQLIAAVDELEDEGIEA